jgi:two-component system response regulator ResD
MATHRIVIVDDEERIRQLLLDFLEDFDEFDAEACDCAETALESLGARPAALCIVDMRLPGMNGGAFILAAHVRNLCPRFILHTGSMDFTITEELRRIGIADADLFLKPSDTGEMLARIRHLLGITGDQ